ncbi:Ig-like domain repeat protein [Methanobrevibacter sp.]
MNLNNKLLVMFVLALTSLILLSPVSANENTTLISEDSNIIEVDDVNGDDAAAGGNLVKSISKAVELSQNGTTIQLSDGVYSGSKNTRITIDKSVDIVGSANTIIDGENTNYLFTVTSNAKVTFKNICFINAYKSPESYAINYPNSVYGSAVEVKNALVLIDNCTFENNRVTYSTNNQYTYGGAISNNGDLTITDSRFISNIAHSTSGLFSYGGAIYNNATLSVANSEFLKSDNDDFSFGGFIANYGIAEITGTTIANAKSAGESRGSAVYNVGDLTLINSIVENNTIAKASFQYVYGAIYNSGRMNGYGNIFRNNTGLYSVPSRGSPTIYSVGDLNLTHNLFLDNKPFEGIYKDVYLNSVGDIHLDNNWWGSNDDPYSTESFNIKDEIHSWLILNVTPDYVPLEINQSVDIKVNWASDIGFNPVLIPSAALNINDNIFDFRDDITYTYADTGAKGLYRVNVTFYDFSKIVEVDVGKMKSIMSVEFKKNITYMDDLKFEIEVVGDDAPVFISIGERTYNISLVNGHGNHNINDLTPGTYDVMVMYNGSENYFRSYYTSKLTVSKRMVSINLTIPEVYFDQQGRATIAISPEGSDSTATITFNAKRKIIYLYSSRPVTIDLGYFAEGEYNVTVDYMENLYFKAGSVTEVLKVKRYETEFNITSPDIKLGQTQTISIAISPEGFSGYAILNINGNDYEIFLENRTTDITIPNLRAGQYNIRLTYGGDDKYAPSTAIGGFKVLKTPSSLTVKVDYDENTLTGNINVKTNARNCTGEIEVYINYKKYHLPLNNGEANFPVAFDKGTNYIYVYYPGDDYWAESDWNTTIGVADEFIMMSGDVEGYEHNDFNYSVRLIEINGVPLPLRTVTISFNGNDYNVTTNSNGYAFFNLNLAPGNYSISASYKNGTVTNNVTVKRIDFNVTAADAVYGENTTFKAVFDKNITGSVNFTIDGKLSVVVNITDGEAIFVTDSLNAGSYTLRAFYTNEHFSSAAKSSPFTISKANSTLSFAISNVIAGEDASITVHLSPNATGRVTFILDGNETVVPVINSNAVLEILNISGAEHEIKIIYGGDGNYNGKSINDTFYIKDLRTDVRISTSNIIYGNALHIRVTVSENATGNVTVAVGKITKTLSLENGVGQINITELDAGEYNVTASYGGDTRYISSAGSTYVKVFKADCELRIVTTPILDENILIYAYLSPNATGYVSFSMPGYYTSRNKEIDDATAVWYISPLGTGSYTIRAEYRGDNNYNPVNASYDFNISQVKTRLVVRIPDVISSERVAVNVWLTTASGEGLTDKVTVTINSRQYTVHVRNGTGTLYVGRMAVGDYDFNAMYEGNFTYNPATYDGRFRVAEHLDVILKVKNMTKYYGDASKLEVTLTDSNHNPLPNQVITVNGRINLTTDDEGRVYVDADYNVGNHTIFISYAGSQKYISSNATVSVTVKSTVNGIDVVKQFGTSSQYFAIFLDSSGRALANTLVTYIIADKSFTASTLPNGISRVNINLNPGYYLIMAINPGTGEYAINSIFVYDRIMENKDLTQSYTQNKLFKVRAYAADGNITGAGQKVTFKVNGKTYTGVTDAKGYASFRVNLKPGTYKVTSSYGGVTKTNVIKVKSIVKAKNMKVKKTAKMFKIRVALKKVNGKYLKAKKVTLKFKGKKYKAKTNKKGVATFKIKKNVLKKLKKGKKYTYRVTYLKDTVKKTIEVK